MALELSGFADIGRYLPQTVLGSGAMGVVYRANDPLLDRLVAVKVMRTGGLDLEQRAEYSARFTVEAKAAGRCYHPSIVTVHDFGEGSDGPFIVMELVDGPTLAGLLRQPRHHGLVPLIALLLRVLDGLAAAHDLGIVHRDIKPSNIIVAKLPDAPLQPKIADFGVARLPTGLHTMAGGMIGTPSYMAPEQALGDTVDRRADVFSAAAILHEILLGRPPFAAPSLTETLQRLTGVAPIDLSALEGSPMRPVLQRGLAKSPAERFPDAAEFAAALRAALARMGDLAQHSDAATVLLRPETLSAGVPQWAAAEDEAFQATASSFDSRFASHLVDELRPILGPIAATLVRRAAARASTRDELLWQLAAALDQHEDRNAFLRRHRLSHPTPTSTAVGPKREAHTRTFGAMSMTNGPSVAPAQSRDRSVSARTEWPDAVMTVAQTALAFHLGPMAKIFVRQAMTEARDIDTLLDRLAAHLPEPREVPAFRRRLKADIEAKLRPTS